MGTSLKCGTGKVKVDFHEKMCMKKCDRYGCSIIWNVFRIPLSFADIKFNTKLRNLRKKTREAIQDIEKVQELLDDVSNNESEYFEADETNINGKKKHDDNEVGITPEEEYEDLRANDFERDAAPGRRRKNKGDAAFAEVF